MPDAKLAIVCNAADFDDIEPPLVENVEDFHFFVPVRDQQHALLRLAEHDFVCRHAGFTLRNILQIQLHAGTGTRSHFATGAGQASGAHILNADNQAFLHRLETGFKQ